MGPMTQAVLVAIGGGVGALARFAVNGWALRQFPSFPPAGTLIANVTGCLAIGIVMAYVQTRPTHARELQVLLVTGVLGGYTTFSAFGFQTVELLEAQQPARALFNVLANVLLGGFAAWIGLVAARRLLGA